VKDDEAEQLLWDKRRMDAEWEALITELKTRGYSDAEIRKILCSNGKGASH